MLQLRYHYAIIADQVRNGCALLTQLMREGMSKGELEFQDMFMQKGVWKSMRGFFLHFGLDSESKLE